MGIHWSLAVERMTRSQTLTLTLPSDVGVGVGSVPARWIAVAPVVVALEPAEDLRSCRVTALPDQPLGLGRQTIKVATASGTAVAYFEISIHEDRTTAPE